MHQGTDKVILTTGHSTTGDVPAANLPDYRRLTLLRPPEKLEPLKCCCIFYLLKKVSFKVPFYVLKANASTKQVKLKLVKLNFL